MSNKPGAKILLEQIPSMNTVLRDKFLHLYLDRCKLRHALAWMEYRKMLKNAEIDKIQLVFEDRKAFLLSLLKKIQKYLKKKEFGAEKEENE